MKKLKNIAIALLALHGCYLIAFPSETLRYRLTLRVDDNGTIAKTLGSFGGYGYEFKGAATAVDLGQKGVLFAIFKDDENQSHPDL